MRLQFFSRFGLASKAQIGSQRRVATDAVQSLGPVLSLCLLHALHERELAT
jgi:hypothetical protein